MTGIAPKLALDSLARIYGSSNPSLPTIDLPVKYEGHARRILTLQHEIELCREDIKKYEKEIKAHSVRIAEVMKNHEHGIMETTTDKILIDFATKTSTRTDTTMLKKKYPLIHQELVSTTESRKLKLSVQPA